jgi:prephenate dehydrogenase
VNLALHTAGIIGLGVMGGSIARALRDSVRDLRILAVEANPEVRASALAAGVVNEALEAPSDALALCEVVFLCTPVAAAEALLGPVSRAMADGAILTDVCGAKERLLACARDAVRPEVSFVAAHPLFGAPPGWARARADLWTGGTVAICTDSPASPAALDRVAQLHAHLGARVVRCLASEHDAAAAMTTHLPHLLASALALSARSSSPLVRALAKADSGLREMTRLAELTFDAQGDLARRNRHLPAMAQQLQADFQRLLGAVVDSPESARAALEAARTARGELL